MALARVVKSGSHAQLLLIAAQPVAEAGDDLVEDQHDALLVANAPQRPREFVRRQDAADIVRDGLEDDSGDFLAPRRDQLRKRLAVVEGQHQRVLDGFRQHAG